METGIRRQAEFKDASPSSLYGQGNALVAMLASNLILLLMLAA